nr:TetR/AcrR family transcriptional regulator [Phytoactinopolyspora alkaliphila]
MELFWEHGYEGTSISDLTRAIGINAPSLYAAFECKEALFREAVDLYLTTAGSATDRALSEAPTAREAVEASLRGNAELYATADRPGGCMVVLAAANYSTANREIRDYLMENRRKTVAAIEDRLRRAQSEGELGPDVDTAKVAAFYATVLHGMAIEARDGVPHARLTSTVDAAMDAWPALTGVPSPVLP